MSDEQREMRKRHIEQQEALLQDLRDESEESLAESLPGRIEALELYIADCKKYL